MVIARKYAFRDPIGSLEKEKRVRLVTHWKSECVPPPKRIEYEIQGVVEIKKAMFPKYKFVSK